MSYTNKVTKSIFELLGDKTRVGYSFQKIPIFLNKDATTVYPQIRVTPFIDKTDVNYQTNIEKTYRKYRHWEAGVFQIDIYSQNLIEAQKIYDRLIERIFDFFNLETLIYDNNDEFIEIDTNTYKNYGYGVGDLFKDIYKVQVENKPLKRVLTFDDLIDDSYYVDEDALYICTKKT